ncbi:MAG: TIGR00730 family Rossman fold protein [Acidimicrobiia bacterium]|nr:TIGR00730 family Rossman fold protein [Acidimicrobiia bacterium]
MAGSVENVCVFCGASAGTTGVYAPAAAELATVLVEAGLHVVYGGADVGLMRVVADTALAAGGRVTGVIPRGLFTREIAHSGLTQLVEVDSMHARKQRMFDLADAFVVLPGGLGTLEEVAEIATWSQLGLHAKPIVLVDVGGFWQPLMAQLDTCVAAGFLTAENRASIASVESPAEVLGAIEGYAVVPSQKWIDTDET